MITSDELATVNAAAINKMVDTGEQWLENLVHGVTSGRVEKDAIEAFLYTYALGQHNENDPVLTACQIRHIYSRLREI